MAMNAIQGGKMTPTVVTTYGNVLVYGVFCNIVGIFIGVALTLILK